MAGNVQSNIHIQFNSNIQDMIDRINELNHVIRGMESGNITFDSNVYEGAVQSLHDLSNEFKTYKEGILYTEEENENFNISIESLVGSLMSMVSTGKLSSASMMALGKSLGVPALAITALTTAIKLGIDQVENFIDDMKKLGEVLGDGTSFAIDGIVDTLGLMIDGLKEAGEAMAEFSEHGIKVQSNFYALNNYLEDEAVVAIDEYANSLNELYGLNPNMYLSNMEGILSVAHNIATSVEEQVAVVTALNNTAYDLFAKTGGAYGNVTAIKTQLENAINLNVLNSRSAIAKALDLTDAMIDEFKELGDATERYNWILEKTTGIQGLYTKWLQTESGQIELLKQQYQLLIDNIGQLALGLYARIAPILNMLLDFANSVIGKIINFFNIDLKSSAMQNSADAYGKIAESIEEIGESAEESRRKVSKFDDVIQINDSGKLDNTLSGTFDDFTFSNDWLDNIDEGKTKIQELAEQLKKLFEDGEYYKAGKLLADTLKGWLKDIPWDDIRKEAHLLGLDISNFLNGLTMDAELFGEIGNAFAQGINTAFDFLDSFASNYEFDDLGRSLGTAWESFWDGLDSDKIGSAIYKWIIGGFETLDGMMETGSLSTAISKIRDIIINIFDNMTDEDIQLMADTLIDVIDEVFDAFGALIGIEEQAEKTKFTGIGTGLFGFENIDIDEKKDASTVTDKLRKLLQKIVEGVSENAEEWGETASTVTLNIIGFLTDAIKEADKDGQLTDAIHTFLDELDPVGIMIAWFELKQEEKKFKFNAFGKTIIDMILTGIVLGLADFLNTLALGLETFKNYLVEKFLYAFTEFRNLTVAILSGLVTVVGTFIIDILELFNADEWAQKGRDILNGLLQGISEGWTSVKNWWNEHIAGSISLKLPDNWIGKAVKSVIGISQTDIVIPRLATGGIVSRSTIANIGEDGTEAVLPLEKNTGWMDSLATKLASKISVAKLTGGNIVLPLSDLNKAFYTRNEMIEFAEMVVEALKVYGVNVAVVG